MEFKEVFEILKPGPLPEPTHCIDLYRTMKHDGLAELYYGSDALHATVKFMGSEYSVRIKPKAYDSTEEMAKIKVNYEELKIEHERLKESFSAVLEELNKLNKERGQNDR